MTSFDTLPLIIGILHKDYGIRVEPIEVDKVQEAARFTRFTIKLKSGETERNLRKYKNDIEIQLEANGEILIDHIKGTGYMSVDVPFADSCKTISLIDKLHLLDSSSGRLDVIAGQMPDGKYEMNLLDKGMSIDAVARELGLSVTTIKRYQKEENNTDNKGTTGNL